MRKEQEIKLGLDLDLKVDEIKGVKGFLIRKIWPLIKNAVIDLLVDFLEKQKR